MRGQGHGWKVRRKECAKEKGTKYAPTVAGTAALLRACAMPCASPGALPRMCKTITGQSPGSGNRRRAPVQADCPQEGDIQNINAGMCRQAAIHRRITGNAGGILYPRQYTSTVSVQFRRHGYHGHSASMRGYQNQMHAGESLLPIGIFPRPGWQRKAGARCKKQ